MSQQVDTGRGRQVKKEGRGGRGGRGYGGGGYRGRTPFVSKAYKYPIVEIASDTFNTGQSLILHGLHGLLSLPAFHVLCQLVGLLSLNYDGKFPIRIAVSIVWSFAFVFNFFK